MLEKFTPAAARVIFLARLEAGRLKSDDIDTRHLLLAFIHNDQNTGALAAHNVYVAADETPEEHLQLIHPNEIAERFLNPAVAAGLRPLLLTTGPRDEALPPHGDMALSERAQRTLSDAIDFAGQHRITPLHLLWAMLGEEQGEIADLLPKYGLNREFVENEIRARNRG